MSPPRRDAQDRGEQAGDLGGIGLLPVGPAPAVLLGAEPVGALAAGRCAVQATTPGARPPELRAALPTPSERTV